MSAEVKDNDNNGTNHSEKTYQFVLVSISVQISTQVFSLQSDTELRDIIDHSSDDA